jgi:IS5 family transposase
MMFKILVIQAQNDLSDERAEFLINDRPSFMRFLGLSLGDRVPDATTIWLFDVQSPSARERLVNAGAIRWLFARLDRAVRDAGYIAMAGQIVDASLVAAPKQRNTEDEKAAIKANRIPEAWKQKPAKLRQKDRDGRWTVKFTKAKPKADGKKQVDVAVPSFGYQNQVSIDREHGLISRWAVTDAAKFEGAKLCDGLLDKTNKASSVWADTAYRSKANEDFLAANGFTPKVHRTKPQGRPMPKRTARANAKKSAVRARVEHVFAEQKDRMDLFVRTISLPRAELKIGMANLVYNIKRTLWLDSRAAPA